MDKQAIENPLASEKTLLDEIAISMLVAGTDHLTVMDPGGYKNKAQRAYEIADVVLEVRQERADAVLKVTGARDPNK